MIKGLGQVFILGNPSKICDVEYTMNEKPRREGHTRMFLSINIIDDYTGFISIEDYVLKTENGKYVDISIIDTRHVHVGGPTYNFSVSFPPDFRNTLEK